MKKIVILNAYGMKNIGDGTICLMVHKMLDKELGGRSEIHTLFVDKNEDISNYKIDSKIIHRISPYGSAIDAEHTSSSNIKKVFRFTKIFTTSILLMIVGIDLYAFFVKNGTYSYIKSIKDSNAAIGMGGGYLRTKDKYKDYFGLILTLLPLYVAKYYKKPILSMPMSFGNFASNHHKKIAFNALKGTTVICRDFITLRELKMLNKQGKDVKLIYAPDLALYLNYAEKIKIDKKINSNYIVLTARKWMNKKKQKQYENDLIEFVKFVWRKYKLKTYFVSMASNSIEDNDNTIANKINTIISDASVFQIATGRNPEQVQHLLNNARAAICTRMHSAILAITVKTPFLTIGYEYKTLGIMQIFKLEEWHSEIETVTEQVLENNFQRLMLKKNYSKFIKKIDYMQKDIALGKITVARQIRKILAI